MDLGKELDNSTNEIFRFEALQEYFSDGSDELENEIKRQWKETSKIDMDLMKEWHDFIKKKHKKGVKFIWVRLVEFPLNDYTKLELYVFKKRVGYGIDIRVISKDKFEELKIDDKDFYLIDGKKVLLMNYGESNEYLGCESGNEEIETYKKHSALLIANSMSVLDFNY